MSYEDELKIAVEAVRKAGRVCTSVQSALVQSETVSKDDRSPVTIADFASQAVVCLDLKQAFPEDAVVGEEDTSALRENDALRNRVNELVRGECPDATDDGVLAAIDHGAEAEGGGGRFWTLDPIDGTKGFLRGDQYAIALALIEDGQVKLGVLGCPNLPAGDGAAGGPGFLFTAVRGEGATMVPLSGGGAGAVHVDPTDDSSSARFCESVESAHAAHDTHAKISDILGIRAEPYRIDSQCKYASVARGDAAIYLRLPSKKGYQEKIWDHAAGMIVVEEAGGQVSDINGAPLDFGLGKTLRNNTGIVATNGALHRVVIEAIASV